MDKEFQQWYSRIMNSWAGHEASQCVIAEKAWEASKASEQQRYEKIAALAELLVNEDGPEKFGDKMGGIVFDAIDAWEKRQHRHTA